ncbi:hypothetical protein GEU84_000550 [Fertoebacter nigrum]|uniref:Uncharacterized protein n=1 Tax=Fertoeibacter niger TaxID=2656921 RepID=A0A8X8KLI0_9RHOB|nr:hypothetical protein [Fertoeibacter niger]NUB42860.1 hypothetical protein [Fertoeibacter niger]
MPWGYGNPTQWGCIMTVDHEELWQKLNDANQIWAEPQFLLPDVCKITGATPKALEHFLDPKRGLVHLMGEWVNPGTGKRRRFTGKQVLMIAAAYTMNRVGFPQRWSIDLTEMVGRRVFARGHGIVQNSGMTILTYPMKNGDWAVVPIYNETSEEPRLPNAVQVLDVDRLIDETHRQLMAIVAGEEVPDFSIPDLEPEPNPFSPKANFTKAWEKDEAGNWLLVGLTLEETQEFMKLRGMRLKGDDLEYFDVHFNDRNPARAIELDQQHELVRLRACGLFASDDND